MSSSPSTTLARMLAAPRRLVGATGSNFYYSFLLLPKAKRRAITDVYRFARLLDDIVDEEIKDRDPYAELQTWRDEIEFIYRGTPTTEFGDRLMESIEEFDIPKQPFLELIEGMEMDLKWHSYQS